MTFLGGGRACLGFKFSQLEMSACFLCLSRYLSALQFTNESLSSAEIVLSLLVKKFKFAPSGKKIIWLSQGIMQPAVEDAKNSSATGKPELQLPLKLTPVAP